MPRRGLINRRRPGYEEKDLTSRTWNVRQFLKTGGLIFLLYDQWKNQEHDERTSFGGAHHRS